MMRVPGRTGGAKPPVLEGRHGKGQDQLSLYASLLVMGLCPAIYQAVRIFFLGQMPDPGAYSIAGQLSWVQLLYEIVQETVLLPLYFFLGQVVSDNVSFGNRVRSGLWLTAGIWTALAVAVSAFARPLLGWMAAAPDIIEASATYIRIESFANIFATLFSFALVALVTLGREKWLYAITGARLVLSILLDCLFFSNLPFSLRLGVNGIGWSNLAANGILFVVALALLAREGVPLGGKLSFGWAREFFQVSSLSGLESFVRNFAYMAMVVRMVMSSRSRAYIGRPTISLGLAAAPRHPAGRAGEAGCSDQRRPPAAEGAGTMR